jgi:hypothetical protein
VNSNRAVFIGGLAFLFMEIQSSKAVYV